jgi:AraC-like DNA-binding protein
MDINDKNYSMDIRKIIYRKCTPSWRIYEQECKACNLTYIVQGEAQYTIDGKIYNAGKGDLICLSEGAIRKAHTFPDRLMHCFSVDFILKPVKGESTELPFPQVCHVGNKNDIERLFFDLTNTWISKIFGYQIKCRGLFLLILHRFLELIVYKIDTESGDVRIKRIKHYVVTNFSKKITVKRMSEMIELNTAYFGTLFKKETGLSFHQFLMRTRIRHAENMLMSGEYTVSAAAEACGFSDVVHFYKHFKSILGFSPSRCIPRGAVHTGNI